MSILVRGMEMPENCGPCPFSKLSMDCRLTGKTVHLDWLKRKRPDWCPLVEVVRTGEGLYDTYTPPDEETAKHVTEVFRKSTERMEAGE